MTDIKYCMACDENVKDTLELRQKVIDAQKQFEKEDEWKTYEDLCWTCIRRHEINDLGSLYTKEEIDEEDQQCIIYGMTYNEKSGMWVSKGGGVILSKRRMNMIKQKRQETK